MKRKVGLLRDIIIVIVHVPAQGPMKREETKETMIKEIIDGKAQEIETEINGLLKIDSLPYLPHPEAPNVVHKLLS